MARWSAMCKPKEHGGMGFMDCRAMNICLLNKWIHKLERGDTNPWLELLRKKYMGDKGFFFQRCEIYTAGLL